jgi:regulator of RNase E activity RraB
MKNKVLGLGAILLVFAFGACSTTTLTQVWKDPELKAGALKKIVVVAIANTPTRRQFFEDELAKHLASHGMSVIKSYNVMTLEEMKDKKGAAEVFRGMGMDAVLAARLVDRKTIEKSSTTRHVISIGHFYGGWEGYYETEYAYMLSPSQNDVEEVAKLETNVWDLATKKLAWSALSDTWLDRAAKDVLLSDFLGTLVSRMKADGMFPVKAEK